MERQLFDWSGWDGDYNDMTFYGVELRMPIGQFDTGTKFDYAFINWDSAILQLGYYDHEVPPKVKSRNRPIKQYFDFNLKVQAVK